MMNIFIGHFWIFELIHKVFEFGQLNARNNLNAQIILKLNVGCCIYFRRCPQLFSGFLEVLWYF